MDIRARRRVDAIEHMADHLLSEGLGAATLRPLAAAAGTSDRMLLYYFADKDELLAAVLRRIAERMLVQLDEAVPIGKPRPFRTLQKEVGAILSSDSIKPFMNLWLDLAAGAARGTQPQLRVAGEIADGFLIWVRSRLKGGARGSQNTTAAFFMACLEGMFLLEAVGRRGIALNAATELQAHLRRSV